MISDEKLAAFAEFHLSRKLMDTAWRSARDLTRKELAEVASELLAARKVVQAAMERPDRWTNEMIAALEDYNRTTQARQA